jgi:hypothetical protein
MVNIGILKSLLSLITKGIQISLMSYHLTPVRILKRQKITGVGETVEKRKPCVLLVEM